MQKYKFSALLLTALLCCSFCACGDDETDEDTDADSEASSVTEVSVPFSIDDIDWYVEEDVIDDVDALSFCYTNNTEYVIADVEMIFTQKEDVTDEDREVWSDLQEDLSLSDDDMTSAYVLGYNRKIADPGETVEGSLCVLNGSYYQLTTTEQLDITEASAVTIVYIDDGTMYYAYYDYTVGAFTTLSESAVDLYVWSENEIAELLPQPEFDIVQVTTDEEDYVYFTAYGVSLDAYTDYVNSCKASGFIEDVSYSSETRYQACNSDGYVLYAGYNDVEESLICSIEAPSEEDE